MFLKILTHHSHYKHLQRYGRSDEPHKRPNDKKLPDTVDIAVPHLDSGSHHCDHQPYVSENN